MIDDRPPPPISPIPLSNKVSKLIIVTCLLTRWAEVSSDESREADKPLVGVALSAHNSAGKACQSQQNQPTTALGLITWPHSTSSQTSFDSIRFQGCFI
jgi:hypothetical protein